MTDQAQTGCITRFTDGPCGNPPTSGLPICGSCLRTLLDEDDPRRRRTLAGNRGLAAGVVHHLAEDPDEQVRAQVAARNDLDTATTNRLADPDRESAPSVLRSMAATTGGAAHAWELLGTDDPTTLAILAANPSVDPDILRQLARYPDPDVSWTASATLSGQPSGEVISDRVDQARTFDGLPLGEPATPLSRPDVTSSADSSGAPPNAFAAAPTVPMSPAGASPPVPGAWDPPIPHATEDAGAGGAGTGALPPRPSPDVSGDGGRRRGLALLAGAGALVVVAVVVLIVAFTGSDADTRLATAGPDPATSATMPEASAPPTTARTTTTSTTTTTTTTPPTTVPAPTGPPPTPAPVVTPPPPGPISQDFMIRPTSGRFCSSVTVTVNFSPAPGYVVITDDTGAQVGGWSGASGQTEQLTLPRSTSALQVNVTAIGTSISVSGSASGDSC